LGTILLARGKVQVAPDERAGREDIRLPPNSGLGYFSGYQMGTKFMRFYPELIRGLLVTKLPIAL